MGKPTRIDHILTMSIRSVSFFVLVLAPVFGAQAQRLVPLQVEGFGVATKRVMSIAPRDEDGAGQREVIFAEDFANGLDGNNGFGTWTTSGANGNVWSSSQFAPTGAYTVPNEIINSASASNGFALFASDSVNSDWSSGTPMLIPNPVDLEGALESPMFALETNTAYEIYFHQALRYCCGYSSPFFVELSMDDGISWPISFEAASDATRNVGSDGLTAFNITAALEGTMDLSQMKFRFHQRAEEGSSHYYWQVDDVGLRRLEGHDMRLVSTGSSTYDATSASSYDSLFYSVYPLAQLRNLPLNMTVLNNGEFVETNAVANFSVTGPNGYLADNDVPVPFLALGHQTTVFVEPNYTPPFYSGTYDVSYTIRSGGIDPVEDNTTNSSFKVDPFLYGRDLGTASSFEDGPGDGSEFVIGNVFYIVNAADLSSVAVLLGEASTVGSIIVGQVRTMDDFFTVLATSQEVQVTADMLNPIGGSNWTQLTFQSWYGLDANTDYLITVEAYGAVTIGQNGTSPAHTSFTKYTTPSQGLSWYYITTTPCVRMFFDQSIGIEENDVNSGIGMGQNLPNPANGTTTIPYTLENTARVTFEVRDMSGKLVLTSNEGIRAAGTYRLNLDTNVLSEGVYTYTMRAGDVKQTKRMTVIK